MFFTIILNPLESKSYVRYQNLINILFCAAISFVQKDCSYRWPTKIKVKFCFTDLLTEMDFYDPLYGESVENLLCRLSLQNIISSSIVVAHNPEAFIKKHLSIGTYSYIIEEHCCRCLLNQRLLKTANWQSSQ